MQNSQEIFCIVQWRRYIDIKYRFKGNDMDSRFERYNSGQAYEPASYRNSPTKGRRRHIWDWLDNEYLRTGTIPKIDSLLLETDKRDEDWLSLKSKDRYANVKIEYRAWKAYHVFFNHISH